MHTHSQNELRQSDDDSSDDEDETAELMRELERIKKEREDDAARKANEVCFFPSISLHEIPLSKRNV